MDRGGYRQLVKNMEERRPTNDEAGVNLTACYVCTCTRLHKSPLVHAVIPLFHRMCVPYAADSPPPLPAPPRCCPGGAARTPRSPP